MTRTLEESYGGGVVAVTVIRSARDVSYSVLRGDEVAWAKDVFGNWRARRAAAAEQDEVARRLAAEGQSAKRTGRRRTKKA